MWNLFSGYNFVLMFTIFNNYTVNEYTAKSSLADIPARSESVSGASDAISDLSDKTLDASETVKGLGLAIQDVSAIHQTHGTGASDAFDNISDLSEMTPARSETVSDASEMAHKRKNTTVVIPKKQIT